MYIKPDVGGKMRIWIGLPALSDGVGEPSVSDVSTDVLTAGTRGAVIVRIGTRFGGNMSTVIILVAVAVVVLALPAMAARTVLRQRRNHLRQTKLDIAFERARRARLSGSGIQGTPYGQYTDP